MTSPTHTLALPSQTVAGNLADRLPQSWVTDIGLVGLGTAAIAGASQVAIPLWFTPVPLSLATFAVLLTGMALGTRRALASTLVFLLAGMAGAPWFADQRSGWEFASFGYILGYVVAAAVVGEMARRRGDRKVWSTVALMAVGSACIYILGVGWLMAYAEMDLATALAKGVVPFLIGDVIKAAFAAALLPATWRLLDR